MDLKKLNEQLELFLEEDISVDDIVNKAERITWTADMYPGIMDEYVKIDELLASEHSLIRPVGMFGAFMKVVAVSKYGYRVEDSSPAGLKHPGWYRVATQEEVDEFNSYVDQHRKLNRFKKG